MKIVNACRNQIYCRSIIKLNISTLGQHNLETKNREKKAAQN